MKSRDALRASLAFKAAQPIPSRLRVAHLAAERRRSMARRLGALAAAVAWLTLGGVLGWSAHGWASRNATQSEIQSVASHALAAHRIFAVEVVHPVEVTAAQEQHLVQWLSKRLGQPLRAPDLTAFGFRLIGGRLLPAGADPAAQFMYENREGQRATLYVQAGDGEKTGFRIAQDAGVTAFSWTGHGFAYALAAGLDRERLLALAEAVYRELEQAAPPARTAL